MLTLAASGTLGHSAGASQSPSGDAQAGEQVFRSYCAMCHGSDAAGMMGMHPPLRGAVGRLSRDGVEVTIRNGRAARPPMPAFEGRLSDKEITDVVAYVASLPEGPRNFGPGQAPPSGGGSDGDGLSGPELLMASVLVALAVVAVVGVVGVVAWARYARVVGGRRHPSPGRDELDRRYASGEVSRDEYLQMRRDIEEGGR